MIVRYDGTLAGLLTVCGRVASGSLPEPEGIQRPPYPDAGLFDAVVPVEADSATAAQLCARVCRDISPRSFGYLRQAFLSEQPGIELSISRYLAFGWKVGAQLDCHLAQADVHAVHCWARRTAHEAHRLQGLARFRETADGTWYAPVRPDANVVPLLARHFARRLDRPWLLHDVGRGIGALGRDGRFVLGTLECRDEMRWSAEEESWQRLWRGFHRHIAIPERASRCRQRRFMPVKYWEYLVEMG